MTNIECLIKACNETNTSYKILDEHSNFIQVGTINPHYFIQTKVPFQRSDFVQICKDKDYTYKLLNNSVEIPFTKSYLDPFVSPDYDEYKKESSYDEILLDILKSFTLPVIIKKNKGSVGRNVFLCRSEEEVEKAVKKVLDQSSKDYDYLVLAQEYIDIKKEYRVVIYNEKVDFVYLKDNSQGEFVGNLSPLHWENSKAILIEDKVLYDGLQKLTDLISKKLELKWAGLDVVEDKSGKYWLIEVNAHPSFTRFVEDNDDETVVSLYKKVLEDLKTA